MQPKFNAAGEIYVDDLTDEEQLDSLEEKFTGDVERNRKFFNRFTNCF